MGWHVYDDGKSLGGRGSEEGSIILEEEHDGGARITLERDVRGSLFAITCGLYGWMVHTRFFGTEAEGRREYRAMQAALAAIAECDDAADRDREAAVTAALRAFIERFP